jgi:hypothetical protein
MVQERSKAVDFFWDSRLGRVSLPLRMTGPVASPKPDIDWGSAGGKLARRKAEESVLDRLKNTPLSGVLGNLGGKLPESTPPPSSSPPSAPPPSSPPPTSSAAPKQPRPAASGGLGINVEEKGFSGNPLLPDMKVRGVLSGTSITGGTIRVTDEKGRVVLEDSLAQKVSKYYTTHDKTAPAAINFRVDVDGKKLIGVSGKLLVAITVTDAAGGSVTKNVEVAR